MTMIPADPEQTDCATAAPRVRTSARRPLWAVALAALAGVALLVGAASLTGQMRTRGKLVVQAALPLRGNSLLGALEPNTHPVTVYLPDSARALAAYFRELGYVLRRVRTGADVPRVYVSELPKDLDTVQPVEARKTIFLRALLPLVLRENERLRKDHERLAAIRDTLRAGGTLEPAARRWLARLYERFAVEPGDLERLLRRVDVVPASLALAQAAMETAWGTSRFVREGNALYGMWTWEDSVPGLVPRERPDDARHRVRAFRSLAESVRAYLHTLNTHWAYADFRQFRAVLRRSGRKPDGLALADEVSRYSQQRQRYTAQLRSVIRVNALLQLDGASLSDRPHLATAALQQVESAALGGAAMLAQEPGR